MKHLIYAVVCLLFLTSCFRTSTPATPDVPQEETPLFSDTHIDNATTAALPSSDLEAEGESEVSPDSGEEVLPDPTDIPEPELSAAAVLPDTKGYVAYIQNFPGNALPWRVYRHDQTNNATTLIYSGVREISSVAVSGDGTTFLITMRETTDATSDFEVYELLVGPNTVTKLTDTTGNENNVSMSVSTLVYVWDGDNATNPALKNIFLRTRANVSAAPTLRVLSPTLSQYEPSISGDGNLIALIRKTTTGNALVLFNISTNSYLVLRSTTDVMRHPSPSNGGTTVAWLQNIGTNNYLYRRNQTTNIVTQILRTTSLVDHPHLSEDGNYITYAQFSTRLIVYTAI
jgi:Tol biopolymer transport system component